MKPSTLLIKNIRHLFTGVGIYENDGRKPQSKDLGERHHVDLRCDTESGLIIEVGQNLNVESGETLIDASDFLVTPSWVDSHTHAIFQGDRATEFFMRWSGETYQSIAAQGGGIHNSVRDTQDADESVLLKTLTERLRRMLKSGTGYVEIKSGYSDNAQDELRVLRLLKTFKSSVVKDHTLPFISPTFLALHAIPKSKTEFDFTNEMISILDTVARESLADHVDAFPESGFFSLPSSLEFARRAADLGLLSKIHCDELSDLKSSEHFIALGARSIDHLQKINKTATLMLENSHTVATLMPATSFYLNLEYANARKLIDTGACVAIATDYNPGTAPCSSMSFTQMLAAKDLKMTPAEIFAASTHNGAKALGLHSKVGTLVKGQLANLNFYRVSSLEEVFYSWIEPERVVQRSAWL